MFIPIVNENDEVIGRKERANINYATDIFRTASVWITNDKGDVLLAQRTFDKKVDPGLWAEAVGGTVEGNDSYEQTALRETEEELGIKDIRLTLGPKQLITTPCRYFVQWYVAQINEPISYFTIQPQEVRAIAWVPRAQLEQELRASKNKYIAALPQIVNLLKGY